MTTPETAQFMVRNLAGIEWSASFCADPAPAGVNGE
jgi:hypothetical protein